VIARIVATTSLIIQPYRLAIDLSFISPRVILGAQDGTIPIGTRCRTASIASFDPEGPPCLFRRLAGRLAHSDVSITSRDPSCLLTKSPP